MAGVSPSPEWGISLSKKMVGGLPFRQNSKGIIHFQNFRLRWILVFNLASIGSSSRRFVPSNVGVPCHGSEVVG